MLDITLAPMALALKEFTVGDTVRVTVSFKYAVAVDTTITIKAGPYYRDILGTHMVGTCIGQTDLLLTAATTLIRVKANLHEKIRLTNATEKGEKTAIWVITDRMLQQNRITLEALTE